MSRSTLADFEVQTRLGAGSFGTVYKVQRKVDVKLYVMKVVRIGELSHRERTDAINEVQILAQLKSPYVVCYYDSFIEKESLHIVMEFCNRGDLQNLLKKAKERNVTGLKEPIVWNMSLQIILGLYYLHKKNILHRDLKSANVFLNKDGSSMHYHLKIGDLGVAKLMDTSTALARTIVGTPYYLSPELCKDMPYRDKSDCWALGVIIYECCTLEHPFEARNQCALIMKIIEAPVKPPPDTSASQPLVNLILWLLQKDPRLRPSIKDILREKEVQRQLREGGMELPEELIDGNTTDYLHTGLPTSLPASAQDEKAGPMDSTTTTANGTVSLMSTLVDDKDAAQRSFRVAAAVLSAQNSSNHITQDPPNSNSNNHVGGVQMGGNAIVAPTLQRAKSGNNAVGLLRKAGSTSSGGSSQNFLSKSTTTPSPTAAAAATAVQGNRVRGTNRTRGNIASEKARTRYQRPPMPSTATTSQQQQQYFSTAPVLGSGNQSQLTTEEAEGDDEEYLDDGREGEEGDDEGFDPEQEENEGIDSNGPGSAADDKESAGAVIGMQRQRSYKDSSESDHPSYATVGAAADAKSEDKHAQSVSQSHNITEEDEEEDRYESDFLPEEDEDESKTNEAKGVGRSPTKSLKTRPLIQQHMHHQQQMQQYHNTGLSSLGASSFAIPSSLMSTGDPFYQQHHMTGGSSQSGSSGAEAVNDADHEMWNSIWTEKRGVVGGESGAVGTQDLYHPGSQHPNQNRRPSFHNNHHHASLAMQRVAEDDLEDNNNQYNNALSPPAYNDSVAPVQAQQPLKELDEMLELARAKAINDLGEGLFWKVYHLLGRHMKQEQDTSNGSGGEEASNNLNIHVLRELETVLSEELLVHGVALVSDAVFRVRALLAFESKCAAFLTSPSNVLAARKQVIAENETTVEHNWHK